MSTYAERQEDAAQGLRSLIARDELPTSPESIRQLLGCREAILDAINDRLEHLGLQPPRHREPSARLPHTLEHLADNAAQLLPEVLKNAPRLPPEQRPRPSSALDTRAADPLVAQWATIGADLLAGNATLDRSAEQAWLSDPRAAWYAVGDLADTIEAVAVLDDRLSETGLLAELDHPGPRMPLEASRVITSQASQHARWYGTNPAIDLAHDPTQEPRTAALGIHLVNDVRDLAPAQRRLGTYLSRLDGKNTHAHLADTRLDTFTTRAISRNQLELMRKLRTATENRPSLTAPNASFALFYDHVRQVHMRSADLVDIDPPVHAPRFLIWQQQEIARATAGRGVDALRDMTPTELTDLAHASHTALTTYGKTLRHELLRDDSGLRYLDRGRVVGLTRDHHRTPLSKGCANLISMPPPTPVQVHWKTPTSRTALRAELDQAPAHRRPPSPFTRPRGRDGR